MSNDSQVVDIKDFKLEKDIRKHIKRLKEVHEQIVAAKKKLEPYSNYRFVSDSILTLQSAKDKCEYHLKTFIDKLQEKDLR